MPMVIRIQKIQETFNYTLPPYFQKNKYGGRRQSHFSLPILILNRIKWERKKGVIFVNELIKLTYNLAETLQFNIPQEKENKCIIATNAYINFLKFVLKTESRQKANEQFRNTQTT